MRQDQDQRIDWEKWFGGNADQRNQNLHAAADVLDRWIRHVIREGLARIEHSNQEAIATTLTDLQAPALAQRVRELNFEGDTPEEWENLLEELSLLALWIHALNKPPEKVSFALSLRQWAGVTIRKNTVRQHGRRESGTWYVWGTHTEMLETGLRAQRIWLQEVTSQTWALILDFAYGQSSLQTPLETGVCYDLELCFYPEAIPLRAIIADQSGENTFTAPPELAHDTDSLLNQYATRLSVWPWLAQFPTGWTKARIHRPVREGEPWLAADEEGAALPLRLGQPEGWELFAFACGSPVQLFGEWDGQAFLPLTARQTNGQHLTLS